MQRVLRKGCKGGGIPSSIPGEKEVQLFAKLVRREVKDNAKGTAVYS